jgi:hypothetical protein
MRHTEEHKLPEIVLKLIRILKKLSTNFIPLYSPSLTLNDVLPTVLDYRNTALTTEVYNQSDKECFFEDVSNPYIG